MSWIDFRWVDLLDILLVAFLLYQIYALLRGTVAINIFLGVAAVYLFSKVVNLLQMRMLSEILNQFLGVGILALIVVFQQEIRKFLLLIGSANFRRRRRFLAQLRLLRTREIKQDVESVSKACLRFAEGKVGALIVLGRNTPLDMYIQTGDKLNAELSVRLLESIFTYTSPLHDGAVIIIDDTIIAARCILPVSESEQISPRLGLRHRAAVGITEKTDAVAVIVSEETGQISLSKGGTLELVPLNALRDRLMEFVND
jgi:uncharacterized protein (TIGR00159 family)